MSALRLCSRGDGQRDGEPEREAGAGHRRYSLVIAASGNDLGEPRLVAPSFAALASKLRDATAEKLKGFGGR